MKKPFLAAIAAMMILSGCTSGSGSVSVAEKTQPPTEPDVIYSSYEEFAADYKTENPDAFEMPLPEESEDMKIGDITLSHDKYTVAYDTAGTEEVEVIVDYSMTGCMSIEGFIAAQNLVPDSEITEKTDEYFIRKYTSGKMELTMLCGDNNTACRLSVADASLTDEELRQKLLEYKDIIGM